ncbi:hypothetical protein [Vibrio metschnikovii]|uniref:Uncharacterized protein n=1 Tax=Vibrio metschnikovii TaxID=28172 RepID=A0A9X0UK63_VIBME|nr:hypothetical protein [Vibrio metschnikovii]MBC5852724.1 hypothetical protein [Vibrio metschnikovii]
MIRITLNFFSGLSIIFLYYLINNDARNFIYSDLHERFGVTFYSGMSFEFAVFIFVDYVIFNISFLSCLVTLKRKNEITQKYLYIIGILSSFSMIVCHKLLLTIGFAGTYYIIPFVLTILSFSYVFIKRNETIVGNFLIPIGSLFLQAFIIFVHALFVHNSLFNQSEIVIKNELVLMGMVEESISNGYFDKSKLSNNLILEKVVREFYEEDLELSYFNGEIGLKDVVKRSISFNSFKHTYMISDISKNGCNYTIYNLRKNHGYYRIEKYAFKSYALKELYSHYFNIIYTSVFVFITLWLLVLFKVILIHGKIKVAKKQ